MNSINMNSFKSKNFLKIHNVDIIKGYNKLFSNFSYKFSYGNLYIITGSNGIGKTTLLKCICGLTYPDKGYISWNDLSIEKDYLEFYKDITYLGHLNSILPNLSVIDNINFLSSLQNNNVTITEKNDYFGILPLVEYDISELSNGQKRRVALSRLNLSEKPLWILDEPLNSVDKVYEKIFEQQIVKHVKRNGIVIISSHNVHQYEKYEFCNTIDLDKINE